MEQINNKLLFQQWFSYYLKLKVEHYRFSFTHWHIIGQLAHHMLSISRRSSNYITGWSARWQQKSSRKSSSNQIRKDNASKLHCCGTFQECLRGRQKYTRNLAMHSAQSLVSFTHEKNNENVRWNEKKKRREMSVVYSLIKTTVEGSQKDLCKVQLFIIRTCAPSQLGRCNSWGK